LPLHYEGYIESNLRSQIATPSEKYGGRRYLPYVYTEQGIAMLSAALHSDVAIDGSVKKEVLGRQLPGS
jgi:hypothetical protein